tara:strand:- start:305 stop:565 length:261 start_codon:yes stop_codon:yes gene_type:complete
MDDRSKKRLKDTKIGKWLRETSPKVLDLVGHLLPDKGVLGVVKNLIDQDPDITHDERMELERLIQSERTAQDQEVSKRWQSDNDSD